jgi:hypothetical protein
MLIYRAKQAISTDEESALRSGQRAELIGNARRNGYGLRGRPIRKAAAHCGYATRGDVEALVKKAEEVGNALFAQTLNGDLDL